MNKQERIAFLMSIPWVKRLKTAVPCDDLKWSKVPLKALYPMYGKPATGTEPYKCKSPGYWRFKALKRSHARDGNYCYMHLRSHLLYDNDEEQRLKKWYEKSKGD